jgi:hypothetical protein
MVNVEVRHCGQGSAPNRYAIKLSHLGAGGSRSSFSNISVHSGYHTAWGTLSSSGATLQHSVLFKTVGTTVSLDRHSVDNWVVGNLALLTINPGTHRDTRELERFDTVATFEDWGHNVLLRNVAAGSERAAYRSMGEPCAGKARPAGRVTGSTRLSAAELNRLLEARGKGAAAVAAEAGVPLGAGTGELSVFLGNSAHSSLFGVFVPSLLPHSPSSCLMYRKVEAWKIWNYGFYTGRSGLSYHLQVTAVGAACVVDSTLCGVWCLVCAGSVHIYALLFALSITRLWRHLVCPPFPFPPVSQDWSFADCGQAIEIHIVGPDVVTHQKVDKFVVAANILLLGRSIHFPCTAQRPVRMCGLTKSSHCLNNAKSVREHFVRFQPPNPSHDFPRLISSLAFAPYASCLDHWPQPSHVCVRSWLPCSGEKPVEYHLRLPRHGRLHMAAGGHCGRFPIQQQLWREGCAAVLQAWLHGRQSPLVHRRGKQPPLRTPQRLHTAHRHSL